MKRLLILALAIATVLALAAPVAAAKPDKPGKPDPDVEFKTCAELGWENELDVLVFGTSDGCEDVPSSPGATFMFTFPDDEDAVTLNSYLVLGVRNSVPGDWCDGWWTVGSESVGFSNALLLRKITPGLTVTLQVDDYLIDGNCTSDDGEVHWNDDSNDESSDWVVTAMGRLPSYKGSIEIGLEVSTP